MHPEAPSAAMFPVLRYSGYGTDIDPDDAARSGVCGLIRRPVEPAALFRLLQEHRSPSGRG